MINHSHDTDYPLPDNEKHRLDVLDRYDILDTPPEDSFDRIVSLARKCLDVPVSLISLVDRSREWHKSAAGTEPGEKPREESFCAHAILQDDPLVIQDARDDDRFQNYPYVTGEKQIDCTERDERINLVAYAGAPLIVEENTRLGTICVVDDRPRSFSENEVQILQDLAGEVKEKLTLRLKNKQLVEARKDADRGSQWRWGRGTKTEMPEQRS